MLSAQVSRVTVLPGQSSFFPVFNSFCGAAPFTVQVLDAIWLQAGPASGTIPSGGSVAVTLLADPPAEPGSYSATVRITGPNNSIDILVTVERN